MMVDHSYILIPKSKTKTKKVITHLNVLLNAERCGCGLPHGKKLGKPVELFTVSAMSVGKTAGPLVSVRLTDPSEKA